MAAPTPTRRERRTSLLLPVPIRLPMTRHAHATPGATGPPRDVRIQEPLTATMCTRPQPSLARRRPALLGPGAQTDAMLEARANRPHQTDIQPAAHTLSAHRGDRRAASKPTKRPSRRLPTKQVTAGTRHDSDMRIGPESGPRIPHSRCTECSRHDRTARRRPRARIRHARPPPQGIPRSGPHHPGAPVLPPTTTKTNRTLQTPRLAMPRATSSSPRRRTPPLDQRLVFATIFRASLPFSLEANPARRGGRGDRPPDEDPPVDEAPPEPPPPAGCRHGPPTHGVRPAPNIQRRSQHTPCKGSSTANPVPQQHGTSPLTLRSARQERRPDTHRFSGNQSDQ